MFKRFYLSENPFWSRVIGFSLVMFFIRIADAIISFWAPNLIQSSLGSPVAMGFVISFQSVVGLVADLILPSLLKVMNIKRMITGAIIMSVSTVILLYFASLMSVVILFLIAMIAWGIYYELESFASHQFVAEKVQVQARSSAWGIIGVFKNMAYFLGPFLATFILLKGNLVTAAVALIFLGIGVIILFLKGGDKEKNAQIDIASIKPLVEFSYWVPLFKHIWPILATSLLLSLIDSTFWTTGAVWTEKLSKINPLGSFFLPFYQLPSLFAGFVIIRWGIYQGKKRWSQICLLIGGVFLVGLSVSSSIGWQLVMILLSSVALSLSGPLLDGVYSDIAVRLGKEKKHIFGFTSFVTNTAYIIWPPIAGLITVFKGERMVFVVIGMITVGVTLILLLVTPKKIKLPQGEIKLLVN